MRYQHIAYKFLGAEIAKRHPGAKILVITLPKALAEVVQVMDEEQWAGFEEGLGDGVTIAAVERLPQAETTDGESDPYMESEILLTAELVERYIAKHPDCDVVVSFVGLPLDFKKMKFWTETNSKGPKFVLVNTYLYELLDKIRAGDISIVLANRPDPYDWRAPVPEDEKEAFDRRFILITPDNAREMGRQYPVLFGQYRLLEPWYKQRIAAEMAERAERRDRIKRAQWGALGAIFIAVFLFGIYQYKAHNRQWIVVVMPVVLVAASLIGIGIKIAETTRGMLGAVVVTAISAAFVYVKRKKWGTGTFVFLAFLAFGILVALYMKTLYPFRY